MTQKAKHQRALVLPLKAVELFVSYWQMKGLKEKRKATMFVEPKRPQALLMFVMVTPPRCKEGVTLRARSMANQGHCGGGGLPVSPGTQQLTAPGDVYSERKRDGLCEAEATSYSLVIRDGTPVHRDTSLTGRTASQGHSGVAPALLGPHHLTVTEGACRKPNP